jgi:hypothetical protein
MKKHFKGVFAVLILTFIMSVFVTANPTVGIRLNDIPVSTGETVYLERGESVDVEVVFTSDIDLNDARVKAWVGGYEYKDVEDKSETKDIQAGLKYKEVLTFDLPEDMDASEVYTLNVQIYDKTHSYEYNYNLKIEEERHKLNILDVIIRPTNKVVAGNAIFGNIRVENIGDKKEEDIKVVFSIPDLGVTQVTYIDELAAHEIDNEDEEDSMSSDDVYLQIPIDATSGIYNLNVDVYYNRGHNKISKTYQLEVIGSISTVLAEKTLLSIDADVKDVAQGAEIVYKIMLANLGDEAQTYSLEVTGEKLWGSSRVDPGFVNIPKDSTGEIYLYLKADENADLGKQMFTIKVKSGNFVVTEKNLFANIVESVTKYDALKKALIIGFSVLIIILIILGLIIAFNKMREGEEEPGEIPTSAEGQAYYYKY